MTVNNATFDVQARRWRENGRFIPATGGRRRTDRLGRAIELVALDRVIRTDEGFAVLSADGSHFYRASLDRCDCPDAHYRGGPCKHAIAVALRERRLSRVMRPDPRGVRVGPTRETRSGGNLSVAFRQKMLMKGGNR